MDDSVLSTIKKMLGLDASYDAFDTDIIVLINSALMIMQQYGAVPKEGVMIHGLAETWSQILPSDKLLEGVKTFIYLKVKMVFDPPNSSYVLNAYKEQAEELEWRIKEQVEAYPGSIDSIPKDDDASARDAFDPDYEYYNPWLDDPGYQQPSNGGDP